MTDYPDGWMGKNSLRWLKKQAAEAQHVVEVGVWLGRSTKAMAETCPGTIYAVDTWEGVPDDPDQHGRLYEDGVDTVFDRFRANLKREIRSGKVIPVRTTSLQAAEWTNGSPCDFVFIDADHRYEAVCDDIRAWLPKIMPGGILAGHDYGWPGVNAAVNELLPGHQRGPGAIWWVRV